MRSASPGFGTALYGSVPLRLLGPFLLLVATAGPARAQDDGARLYMLAPDKTTIASLRLHQLHSDLAVDPGTVVENARLDTHLAVFQFVQALNFSGNQGWIFLVVPASRITESADTRTGAASQSTSGLGDVQLGFVYGVHGTPALRASDYAEHRPGLAVNLLAKLFFPTGSYSQERSINVGANRWAVRLGAPIVYAIGTRMGDPHLITIEAMPTITVFGANDAPYGAVRTHQKPLFLFEGHITRGFSKDFWAGIDLLWREGGPVVADGADLGNRQRALSLAATGTLALGHGWSLRLSGGGVVARNEHGPNGWMLRSIIGAAF